MQCTQGASNHVSDVVMPYVWRGYFERDSEAGIILLEYQPPSYHLVFYNWIATCSVHMSGVGQDEMGLRNKCLLFQLAHLWFRKLSNAFSEQLTWAWASYSQKHQSCRNTHLSQLEQCYAKIKALTFLPLNLSEEVWYTCRTWSRKRVNENSHF